MTLPGDWQVALLENFWPAMVRNVTDGKLPFQKACPARNWLCKQWAKNNPTRRLGIVSMRLPPQYRKQPVLEFSALVVGYLESGWYSSIEDIVDSIMKIATGKDKENN